MGKSNIHNFSSVDSKVHASRSNPPGSKGNLEPLETCSGKGVPVENTEKALWDEWRDWLDGFAFYFLTKRSGRFRGSPKNPAENQVRIE